MDIYEIRAQELMTEQIERFEASTKTDAFWDDFELDQCVIISRFRRISQTYERPIL